MQTLDAVYEQLKNPVTYKRAVKKRIAKIILGASVIRAFEDGTKPSLFNCLIELDVDSVCQIQTKKEFDQWHARNINSVYNCVLKTNQDKFKESLEGLMWGHATKVFNLYLGHLFHYSPYFDPERNDSKVSQFLHIPLDSKVFKVLKVLDTEIEIEVPKTIKSINEEQYRKIQNILREVAQNKGVDPLRFDDYAWAQLD